MGALSIVDAQGEALLEALARVDFPVNPQICHGDAQAGNATSTVEFPAYSGGLERVRSALASGGFDPNCMRISGMLAKLQSLLDHEASRPGRNSS